MGSDGKNKSDHRNSWNLLVLQFYQMPDWCSGSTTGDLGAQEHRNRIYAGWVELAEEDDTDCPEAVDLTCIIHKKFITMMDLTDTAAFYSQNVLYVLHSTNSLIFIRKPCIITHLYHLITMSHE